MPAGPDLTNPELWYAPEGSGYVLTDPLQRDALDPNMVPQYLEDTPLLHAGLGFLRSRGTENTLTIGYGRHYAVEDLGNPDIGWYEHRVRTADYYGYEFYGCDANGHEQYAQDQHNLLLRTDGSLAAFEAAYRIVYGDRPTVGFRARRDRALGLLPYDPKL